MNRMEKAMQEDCARNLARREPGVVPSIQLAEQAIAGMADIVRELNELRQFKATDPYAEHLDQGVHSDIGDPEVHVPQGLWHSIREELQALREEKAQAAERYARWEQNEIAIAEALRDDKRELLAERARLRAKHDAIVDLVRKAWLP